MSWARAEEKENSDGGKIKADGRTGERWGISGLRLGEQYDPC